MALTVSKPQTIPPRKIGLTPLGVAVAACATLLIVAAVIAAIVGQADRREELKAAQPVANAVDYALTVAKQTAAALGTDADAQHVKDFASLIEGEKDPLKRADATQTLLGEMLALAQDNQASIDEINGAKNRVQLAVRDYKNR